MLRYLYFNETIREAVAAPRVHHQLIPMEISHEADLNKDIVDGLKKVGHKMVQAPSDSGFSSVTAIGCDKNKCMPVYDPRRVGSSSIF